MNDTDFHQEQLSLLRAFGQRLETVAATPGNETLSELSEQFKALNSEPQRLLDDGPALVSRLLTTAPQLAEHFPRDLLWYLGAECLHFMPDEEIERFGVLDEARRAAADRGETFNWREAKVAALGLQ